MRRLAMIFAAATSLYFSAMSAVAQPASAPPGQTSTEQSGLQLVLLASILRLDMAAGPHVALARLQPGERVALAEVISRPEDGPLWAELIGGATQFVRVDADEAESVWWNPLADAGLVLHWRRGTDRWRLDGAAPFTGAVLRGTSNPAWAGTDSDPAGRIHAAALATRQAVESGAAARILADRPSSGPALAASAAVARSVFVRGDEAGLNADRIVAGASLLVSGRLADRPDSGLGRLMAQIPGEARARLRPVQRISDDHGVIILWGSPGMPNALLALRYPASAPAAVVPADVTVIDLITPRGEQP